MTAGRNQLGMSACAQFAAMNVVPLGRKVESCSHAHRAKADYADFHVQYPIW